MTPADREMFPKLAKIYDEFMSQGILDQDTFDALTKEEQAKAFVTLGASNDVMAKKLTDMIGKAISEGMLPIDFVRAIDPKLANPSYWDLVFKMNTRTAWSNGNISELFFGDFADDYPAWRLTGPDPAEEPDCPGGICAAMFGLAFDKNDPEARRRMPLLHFGCRHKVGWLTQEDVDRMGITDAATMPEPPDGFGEDKVAALPAALR